MDNGFADDDLIKEFVNESREHLATIEEDLLLMEEGGADIDEALVNKVFRAAHSIKGGSGFFGLDKVKELAHKAETVLDMLRSRKMAPNAEVTNVLLAAFDKLREMINNTEESRNTDISDLLVSLTGLASSYLPPHQKATLHEQVRLEAPTGTGSVTLPQTDIDRAMRIGHYIYWIDCDLIYDIEKKGENVLSLFNKLSSNCEILDCTVDYEAVGTLEGPLVGNRVPLRLVISTIMSPDLVGSLFDTMEKERIHLLAEPQVKQPVINSEIDSSNALLPPSNPETIAGKKIQSPPVQRALKSSRASVKPASPLQSSQTEETLRVNVRLLETLMNLAGELVLSRNQLRAAVAQDNRHLLASVDQRVNQITL